MENDTTYDDTSTNRYTGTTSRVPLKTQRMKAKMITPEQIKKLRVLEGAIFRINSKYAEYVFEEIEGDLVISKVNFKDKNRVLNSSYEANVEKITEKTFVAYGCFLGTFTKKTIKFSDLTLIDYVDEATFNQKEKAIDMENITDED